MSVNSVKNNVLYPNAHWYFALAVLTTWIGFSTSYFGRLLQTGIYHHIHGATAGLWMLLLIVQPLLYKKGKISLHRKLGKISAIVLVPLLVLGGIKMMHTMMSAKANYPPGSVYTLSYIDMYSLVLFILFFGLGIWYGKKIQLHARYMACTVLTVLPPAITRLLFFIPWFDSFSKTLNASFIIVELVFLLLIADDRRLSHIRVPYIVAILLFIVLHVTMNLAGNWNWWKSAMDQFATINL
ncbi:hypothetical protein [Pedobacter metabolipauper]|uniref:Uncharacterized protein n=1 Tax=Pedobacter metabolipauper TaxID=425513 RepID=A0A4R6SVW1_9SPHI|nr:hypothetical protein [Pedobacter metabolipauper]TDQ09213.1 hypothetical protein ATK78_1367 [Pedobacter metabolipauper]